MLTDMAESPYEDRAVFRPSGGSIEVFSLQGDEKQAGILGSFTLQWEHRFTILLLCVITWLVYNVRQPLALRCTSYRAPDERLGCCI